MAGPSQLSPSVTASAVLADIFFLHVHARDKSNHASVLAGIRWGTMECRKMKVMYTPVQGVEADQQIDRPSLLTCWVPVLSRYPATGLSDAGVVCRTCPTPAVKQKRIPNILCTIRVEHVVGPDAWRCVL